MMNVEMILRRKGRDVVTAHPEFTVLEAARLMNERRIGSVVVTEKNGREVVGILTERDILTRLVAEERDAKGTRVEEIMTREVRFCTPRTEVGELRGLMQEQRIRHVPVCEGRELCGLVSIGDLNALEAEGMSQALVAMEEYIGRG